MRGGDRGWGGGWLEGWELMVAGWIEGWSWGWGCGWPGTVRDAFSARWAVGVLRNVRVTTFFVFFFSIENIWKCLLFSFN